jgi:hypothetical protein
LYSGIINLFNVASRTNTNNKLRKTLKIDSINGYNIGANVKYGNIVEINASDKDFALKDSNT